MNQDQRWMLATISILVHAKDYRGAFLMCLIAIDSLAWKRYPDIKSNGKRFQDFLREQRTDLRILGCLVPDPEECKKYGKLNLPALRDLGESLENVDRHVEEMLACIKEWKKTKRIVPIEMILWKCRCSMVHEGAKLAVDGDYDITLDWSIPLASYSIQVDQDARNVVVLSGPYLLNALCLIVAKHLAVDEAEDRSRLRSPNDKG